MIQLQKQSTRQLSTVDNVLPKARDACATAYPGVMSSIMARSHTFVEIDPETISTVILLPSAESFKKGCCQLHEVLGNRLFKLAQEKV